MFYRKESYEDIFSLLIIIIFFYIIFAVMERKIISENGKV